MKKIILSILLMSCFTQVNAQDKPEIKDLIASLRITRGVDKIVTDSASTSKIQATEVSSLLLNVYFITKNINEAHTLVIKVGKEQNDGKVLEEQLQIIHTTSGNNIYALRTKNGNKYRTFMINGSVSFNYSLKPEDQFDIKYITVSILDAKNKELLKSFNKIN